MAPEEAARRAATGQDPIWISSPGQGATDAHADADAGAGNVGIGFDAVATDPSVVHRGASLDALEDAWTAARDRWSATGALPGAEIPIAVGWLSYDLARAWIPIAARARDDDDWPLSEFRFFDAVWMCLGGQSTARILACDDHAADRLAARLRLAAPGSPGPPRLGRLEAPSGGATDQKTAHGAAVATIQRYLRAGDAYQVNLARRMTATVGAGDPLWMAATLRARAPAPHAVWIGGRSRPESPQQPGAIDRCVLGNSPERLLRVGIDREVETRPIKGTRPRGRDARSDQQARASLLVATKDRAEHVMIVDLERNDLGRICETGSVTVASLLRVVELPTVFHLESTVRGRLRADVGLRDLIQATFPGGSVTGAPKRRAMEIIEELEPVRRGIYTGATGWLGAAGDLDLAVAIRTATIAAGRMSLSVGGGIVIDSDPASEWDETEAKARAFADLVLRSRAS